MANFYYPYPLLEMMADSNMDTTIKKRIVRLVELGKVQIKAAKSNTTFVAYSGTCPMRYDAVLQVKVMLDATYNYAFGNDKIQGQFYLEHIVDVLSRHRDSLMKYQ